MHAWEPKACCLSCCLRAGGKMCPIIKALISIWGKGAANRNYKNYHSALHNSRGPRDPEAIVRSFMSCGLYIKVLYII